MRRLSALLVLVPWLVGFDGERAREALDLALHNLYGVDVLAAVELSVEDGPARSDVAFAYGRKRKGDETRTLLYLTPAGRDAPRALLFQTPGRDDRVFVTDGSHGRVRPMAAGQHDWPLFGTDFSYEDFRTHTADDYRIEVLGQDRVDGEPCRVLRLRPLEGPYTMLLAWLSTRRPVIVRVDYFDRKGLWKRYLTRVDKIVQQFDWWVPMQDEMLDLRSGRRTQRRIRNLMLDTEVPEEMFTTTQLSRGRLPSF
jgi:hypothetical protein